LAVIQAAAVAGRSAVRRSPRPDHRAPALASTRLEELPEGGLRIRFKRPWSDGTEGARYSPSDWRVIRGLERMGLASELWLPRSHRGGSG